MSRLSGGRPPPTDFFETSSHFSNPHRVIRVHQRRNSFLTSLSTTLGDIVSIATLANPEDTSSSSVDTQQFTGKTFDHSCRKTLLPFITPRSIGEDFRSPVRLRTVHRHMRFRSDGAGMLPPELPQPAQIIRESYLHFVDLSDREDLKSVETVYYLPVKLKRKVAKLAPSDWYAINPEDHFLFRYEILEFLGLGAFGKVARCFDHKTGETVALKVFKKTKSFERQATVEIRLFDVLQAGESSRSKIVSMKEWFKFRGHVCLVYELLSLNLHECLRQNEYKGFSPGWIRKVTYQLLEALVELKTCRILHCDIKPDNIVFTQDNRTSIKVIDLGSGAFEDETVYTYIQSRFYRAPEVILGCSYSYPIDMWSLGCVVAELFLGRPLFIGEDEHDQLLAIMEILGQPPEDMLLSASKKRMYFYDDSRPKIVPSSRSRRIPASVPLARAVPTGDGDFLNFIASNTYIECLEWQPDERLKPEEGLLHPFVLSGLRSDKIRKKSEKRLSQASTDPRNTQRGKSGLVATLGNR